MRRVELLVKKLMSGPQGVASGSSTLVEGKYTIKGSTKKRLKVMIAKKITKILAFDPKTFTGF